MRRVPGTYGGAVPAPDQPSMPECIEAYNRALEIVERWGWERAHDVALRYRRLIDGLAPSASGWLTYWALAAIQAPTKALLETSRKLDGKRDRALLHVITVVLQGRTPHGFTGNARG